MRHLPAAAAADDALDVATTASAPYVAATAALMMLQQLLRLLMPSVHHVVQRLLLPPHLLLLLKCIPACCTGRGFNGTWDINMPTDASLAVGPHPDEPGEAGVAWMARSTASTRHNVAR